MARVTVEDCLKNVKNRFELVLIAAKRARQLMRGTSDPKVAWDNDKPTVVALREIAAGYTQFDQSQSSDDDFDATDIVVQEEIVHIESDDSDANESGTESESESDTDGAPSESPQE